MTQRPHPLTFRHGTAMLEFIMVIPLLAVVIAGTFFFGQLMRNQQRLRIADRYEAWQPEGDSNPLLFDGRGENVSIRTGTGPTETLEDLYAQASGESPEADRLAEWLLLTGSPGRFPRGWSRRVDAEFPKPPLSSASETPSPRTAGNTSSRASAPADTADTPARDWPGNAGTRTGSATGPAPAIPARLSGIYSSTTSTNRPNASPVPPSEGPFARSISTVGNPRANNNPEAIRGEWERVDSNHRRHKPTDLQSVPFVHSGTLPQGGVSYRNPFVGSRPRGGKNASSARFFTAGQ
jgi:hypothetical protein